MTTEKSFFILHSGSLFKSLFTEEVESTDTSDDVYLITLI